MHSNKKFLPCKVEHLESKGVVTSKSLIQYWWLVYLEWVEDSVEQQCLETKRPVILPKTHYVSKLILQHVHRNLGHAGRNHMLSTLQKRYWIINANSACRKVITECVVGQNWRTKNGWLTKEKDHAIFASFFQHLCGLLWTYWCEERSQRC